MRKKDLFEYLTKNILDPWNSINLLNICAELSDIDGFNFLMDKGIGYVQDCNGLSPAMIFEYNSDISGLNAVMNQLIGGKTNALERFTIEYGTKKNHTWIQDCL